MDHTASEIQSTTIEINNIKDEANTLLVPCIKIDDDNKKIVETANIDQNLYKSKGGKQNYQNIKVEHEIKSDKDAENQDPLALQDPITLCFGILKKEEVVADTSAEEDDSINFQHTSNDFDYEDIGNTVCDIGNEDPFDKRVLRSTGLLKNGDPNVSDTVEDGSRLDNQKSSGLSVLQYEDNIINTAKHSHTGAYKCVHCHKTFSSLSQLKIHTCPVYKIFTKYECEVCKKQFSNLDNLKLHGSVHRQKQYMCNDCDEIFFKFSDLKGHINGKHKQTLEMSSNKLTTQKTHKIYACGSCDKKYFWILNLKTHIIKEHSGIGDYKCLQCDKMFSQYYTLKSHILKKCQNFQENSYKDFKQQVVHESNVKQHSLVSKERGYVCNHCGEKFITLSLLENHIQIDHSEGISAEPRKKLKFYDNGKKFVCAHCDKRYYGLQHLRIHIKTIHLKINDYKCELCNETFSTFHSLQIHTNSDHENSKIFKCYICKISILCTVSEKPNSVIYQGSSKYVCKNCVKEHVFIHANVVNYEEKSKTTRKKRKKYPCGYCDKYFTFQNLKNHIRRLHSKHSDYECEQCNKSFYGVNELRRHYGSELHKNFKKFVCQICNKRFSNLSLIKQHSVVHEKKECFCEYCGKEFFKREKLRIHITDVHLRNETFQCEHCGKAFSKLKTLEGHVKCVHNKIRNFECKICSKKFEWKIHLKNHIICVHEKVRNFVCEQCGSRFLLAHHLRNHVNAVHKDINV